MIPAVQRQRPRVALLLAALLLCLGCERQEQAGLPFFRSAALTPEWIAADAAADTAFHRIADFRLRNQANDTIGRADIRGKICVANFFFVRCSGICPGMQSNLQEVQQAFRDDDEILLLSHSVTPELDSVPILRNYARANNVIRNKWHLLTGSKEEMYSLARDSYFADFAAPGGDFNAAFLHSENFILLDKEGRIRGVYNGTLALDLRRLIEDIGILKQEYAG